MSLDALSDHPLIGSVIPCRSLKFFDTYLMTSICQVCSSSDVDCPPCPRVWRAPFVFLHSFRWLSGRSTYIASRTIGGINYHRKSRGDLFFVINFSKHFSFCRLISLIICIFSESFASFFICATTSQRRKSSREKLLLVLLHFLSLDWDFRIMPKNCGSF